MPLIAVYATAVWVLADGGTRVPPSKREPGDDRNAQSVASAANAQVRTVTIRASDGVPLEAWIYRPAAPNGRMVIVMHGIASGRADMPGFAGIFLRHGYKVLTPDLRGHGGSGGLRVTYGVLEKDDTARWIAWAKQRESVTRIVGFGESLGGSVLLESMADLDAVVAECAYAEFPDVATERVGLMMPLPGPVIRYGLVWPAISLTRLRTGVDLSRASAIEAVRRNAKPVLLIHGLADHLTPITHSRRLRAAAPDRVTLWEVPGAVHVGAWTAAGDEFERRVIEFVNRFQ